jgi:hypothetical protein
MNDEKIRIWKEPVVVFLRQAIEATNARKEIKNVSLQLFIS